MAKPLETLGLFSNILAAPPPQPPTSFGIWSVGREEGSKKIYSRSQTKSHVMSPLDSTINIQLLNIMYIDELIARRLVLRELESIFTGAKLVVDGL